MDQIMLLRVDGAVEHPLALTFDELTSWPEMEQVHDVSRFQAKRRGDGVTLEAILRRAVPTADANYLTLHADHDDFHVSIPLSATRGEGLVVYREGAESTHDRAGRSVPLPDSQPGGLSYR